jgi:predicted aconitase with swiveling domain
MTERILKVHKVAKGKAVGEALISRSPISFLGGINPQTGIVVERGHELEGQSISGKILVYPVGKGSTAGSFQVYELACQQRAPKAIVNVRADPIVAAGAIISNIPMVDHLDENALETIRTGDIVEVDADGGFVTVKA